MRGHCHVYQSEQREKQVYVAQGLGVRYVEVEITKKEILVRSLDMILSAGAAKRNRKIKNISKASPCDPLPWRLLWSITLLLGCAITIFVILKPEEFDAQEQQKEEQQSVSQLQPQQGSATLPAVDEKDEFAKFCKGRLVYVYNISEVYNRNFITECATFKKGRDLCIYMENLGMGRGFSFGGPPGESEGPWHNTWQFALELYFHERLLRHPCLTEREELANAFFVPYYAGMDLSRRFTHRLAKGELYLELAKWLQERESWKRRQGRDHFMVLGRIASDFHRPGADPRLWGNEMLLQKPFKEMVKLTIERSSTRPGNDKEIAMPYPTYFHPSSDGQIQDLVDWLSQHSQRNSLVTMAAGQRRPSVNSMRFRLMTQCGNDPRCTLLLCEGNEASPGLLDEIANPPPPVKLMGRTLNVSCNNPAILLGTMHQSQFCLQPPGDSPTRRSFFDAMLAGCIPVIFSKEAAWSQYVHHLPNDGAARYSVYIPLKVASRSNVINILSKIREPEIRKMQSNIAKILPSVLYGHVSKVYKPESPAGTPDAFDIALSAVLERILSGN